MLTVVSAGPGGSAESRANSADSGKWCARGSAESRANSADSGK